MPVETHILPPRYQRPERIGLGGMGEIYLATDSVLGRPVAVKLLAERYANDGAVRMRFTREALAAARLSGDPNIVTIFDVGEWNGRPFIVMEYLEGGSLEDALRAEGAQPPGRALAWLAQAARALDAAHAAGVVHRDVKPANLLLDGAGDVRVADFGIATAAGLDSMTRTGTILGTAGYLAPEQALGRRAGPASDRYAFAVVAFELLTGHRPYENDNPTAEASAHVHAPVPAASALRRELPPSLDAVFDRGLAKDPAGRYGSCAELVAAIRHAFGDAAGRTERVVAAPPGPTRTTRAAAAPAPPRSPSPARPRRSLVPLLLIGLLAAAVAGIAVASLLGGGETAEEQAPPGQTIVTTVVETRDGTTVRETVTREAPAEPPPEEEQPPPVEESGPSGAELNDQGFARMQAGDYAGALPLLEQAVADLSGSGELAEAYALYNLAYTRLQLGRCDQVMQMLNRSEQIQGRRSEIDSAREQAREQCD